MGIWRWLRKVVAMDGQPEKIVDKEVRIARAICDGCGIPEPNPDQVRAFLLRAQEQWGPAALTSCVFVPQGITTRGIFRAIGVYNAKATTMGRTAIKLFQENDEWDWWMDSSKIGWIPTKMGVILNDHPHGQPIPFRGHNLENHLQDVASQGADGLPSVEQIGYCFLHGFHANSRAFWAPGSCRCQNGYYSDESVSIGYIEGEGLLIGRVPHTREHRNIGTFAFKRIEEGS
ncbi:MAG: hypothetical protein HW405_240 [Candidatus Berkelbacteria bacterium]|nr:hypothetical protein [Candidatus Berkelbacteria bacterium]